MYGLQCYGWDSGVCSVQILKYFPFPIHSIIFLFYFNLCGSNQCLWCFVGNIQKVLLLLPLFIHFSWHRTLNFERIFISAVWMVIENQFVDADKMSLRIFTIEMLLWYYCGIFSTFFQWKDKSMHWSWTKNRTRCHQRKWNDFSLGRFCSVFVFFLGRLWKKLSWF